MKIKVIRPTFTSRHCFMNNLPPEEIQVWIDVYKRQIKSTTASECITSLSRMHIGRNITIPLSVLFRFLPTMQEESAAIKDAMRMREIQFGTKKFWQNPMALLEYRFIPLMISVVKIGDELSAAALTRGLDNPAKRSSITRVGFTCYDAIAVVISGVMLFVTLFIIKW